MVLAGLSVRTFNCRVFRGLSLLSLPSALLLLNPTVVVSSIGTPLSIPLLSLRVLLFLRTRLGDWGGTLRCRLKERTVKREWWRLDLERDREGLRGERRGKEEWKRRRRFVTWGIVFQFIRIFLILARVLELRLERYFNRTTHSKLPALPCPAVPWTLTWGPGALSLGVMQGVYFGCQ